MKRYSLLQPLYLSFFSRDLYRDVRSNWKGTGFLYLLLLLALTWMPVMAKLHASLAAGIRQEAPKFVNQVPKITILHGEVSIDRPVPYTIADPDSGTPLLVIDTSGQISSLDQTPAVALLTKDKFMFRQERKGETRIHDLAAIDEFTLDRDRVNGWVQAFGKYFATVAYPFALAGSFVYRILQMLLYAAIGLLFAKMLNASLDYVTVLRLASVSITPAVILSTLRTVVNVTVPAFWLLCFAVAMGYLFFAVKANAEAATPVAPAA
jgi:uncharacterized protein DUF1189